MNEDHEHNISFSQINLSEARENFFKNTKAHHAQKDLSEALEQFHRKRASLTGCECRLPSLLGNYLRTLFYLKLSDLSILLKHQEKKVT